MKENALMFIVLQLVSNNHGVGPILVLEFKAVRIAYHKIDANLKGWLHEILSLESIVQTLGST